MNSTYPTQSGEASRSPAQQVAGTERTISQNLPATSQLAPKRIGYGLPCGKCKTYYAAGLRACPVCQNGERVSPTAVAALQTMYAREDSADPAAQEEKRERSGRESKSPINAAANFRCSTKENHQGAFEPASACQRCYDHLQERVDLMEAALHMDPEEAANVVYHAVWSDTSDPTKTYQNAAQALLTELRKRAGISARFSGRCKPLPH